MKELPWWKRYYDSGPAMQLFGRNSGWKLRERAVDIKKASRLRLYYIFFFLVIVFSLFWLMDRILRLSLPLMVTGMTAGLLVAMLAIVLTFVLPVMLEQYGIKRGWLNKPIKSNRKRR